MMLNFSLLTVLYFQGFEHNLSKFIWKNKRNKKKTKTKQNREKVQEWMDLYMLVEDI